MKIFFLSLSLLLTACLPGKGSISINQPYAFATVPNARSAAAFMEIANHTGEDDTLLSVKSNGSEITEIHENMIDPDDGMMMMRKIRKLDIPAGETVTLEPTGYHIMFIRMTETLKAGESFPLTLTFEKAGAIETAVSIVPPGQKP